MKLKELAQNAEDLTRTSARNCLEVMKQQIEDLNFAREKN